MKIELDVDLLRRILLDLRVSVDDADHLFEDMLRPLRHRELGPVTHRDNYRDARKKIFQQLQNLFRLIGIEEPPPPSGGEGTPSMH